MLSNQQLKELFKEAEEQGFISDEYKDRNDQYAPCNSECDECPASPACEQLSVSKDYKTFVANYKELYNVNTI